MLIESVSSLDIDRLKKLRDFVDRRICSLGMQPKTLQVWENLARTKFLLIATREAMYFMILRKDLTPFSSRLYKITDDIHNYTYVGEYSDLIPKGDQNENDGILFFCSDESNS